MGNRARLAELIGQLDYIPYGWRDFFRLVGKLRADIDPEMRNAWLNIWISDGDGIRSEVRNGHILARALRVLLPPYTGGPVTLYRGDSSWNRKRRTYGVSWSLDRDVAEAYATGKWRTCKGGSVLLMTKAPANAIICAPHLLNNDHGKVAYVVDRRRLRSVCVLARFPRVKL